MQVKLESRAEKKARRELVSEFESKHPETVVKGDGNDSDEIEVQAEEFRSYVRLPEKEDLEKLVLERRKKEAIERFEQSLVAE